MSWSSERLSFLIALTAAGIMAAAGTMIRLRLNELITSGHTVVQSQENIAHLQSILADITTVESGQRGFLITGRPEQLAEFQAGRVAVESHITQLRTPNADQPEFLSRLNELQKLIEQRVAVADDGIIRRQRGQAAEARAAVESEQTAKLMTDIRQKLTEMTTEQGETLRAARASALRSAADTRKSILSLIFGLIPVLLAGFAVMFHELTRRRKVVKSLHELSHRDALTGLYNRREFDRRVAEACKTGCVALVLSDLDHFKQINDCYGHLVGDSVLQWTAEQLRRASRDADAVARIGGEEFAVLLPGATPESAAAVAERLRLAIATLPFQFDTSEGKPMELSITISVGWVYAPAPCEVLDLLTRGDLALYSAKANGRNRVEAAN
ncbi:MAG: diguanylate cyclase [Gemmataceae bacterium]|nr:diguanylate cyclase [Gemmataceae bacterium]